MARLGPADRQKLVRALQSVRHGGSSAARALYARLRGLSAAEVMDVLEEAGQAFARDVEREVREQILGAQRLGARAATDGLLQTMRRRGRLPGGMEERAASWLRRRIAQGSYRVSPLTGTRTAAVSQDGVVWLSRAIHGGNSRAVITGLRQAITEAVRQGETASSLAQRLRDEVGHRAVIGIPPQVAEMEQAALRAIRASGDPRIGADLARTRREFQRYKDGLTGGKYGTKSAARQALADLESAVRRGSVEAVDRAIKWYAWNRAAEHEALIARTETARAFNAAYIAGGRAVPWVSGWLWVSEGESCDDCMALDGTFIARDASGPFPPRHPNCDCGLEEVIDPDVEPTEAQWAEMLAGGPGE